MATTTPDDLWSPDGVNPYALTTDLAAMQDTVQDAFNGFGARKGTTTQMNDYLAAASPNERWLNTTDGKEYRKISGAWVSQDTGWIQVTTFQNSFTASTSELVFYRRIEGITWLKGDLKRATAPAALTAFTLPVGFRPGSGGVVRLAGRPEVGMGLIIDTAGNVIISATTAIGPGAGSGYALAGFSFPAEG